MFNIHNIQTLNIKLFILFYLRFYNLLKQKIINELILIPSNFKLNSVH